MDAAGNPGKFGAQVNENPGKFAAQAIDWKKETVKGTLCGMLIGGIDGKNASTSKDAQFADELYSRISPFGKAIEKSLGYRLSRATRGSVNGGVAFGTVNAMYFGVHNWVAEKRRVLDLYNTAVASSATLCTFTMMVTPAGTPAIARAVFVVSVTACGTAISLPLGWVHLKFLEKLKKKEALRAATKVI